MKTLFSLLLCAVMGASVYAQDTQKATFSMSVSGDDPQVEMAKQFLEGSTMDMYSNAKSSRVDMHMGTMMTTSTIVDIAKEEALTLSSGMMGKTATKMSLKEMREKNKDEKAPAVKLVDGTKEIAGFKCKKAIVTTEEGLEVEVWYTDEIKVPNASDMNMGYKGIPGFPAEWSIQKGPMNMLFTMTKYEPKVKTEKGFFDLVIPEGYKEVSLEDLKAMGKE